MTGRSHPMSHAAFGRARQARAVPLDAPLHWGCSGKGWNCCVDQGITVRPYDLIRLRHALQLPAQSIINDELVTFGWYPGDGSLVGSLAHRPYDTGRLDDTGRLACRFLLEVTDADARALAEQNPDAFRALPPAVQRAAMSPAREEWLVAGLCGVHAHRPEVCRAFPFQRDPATPAGAASTHRCGSCALSTPTTARDVMLDEGLVPYWAANEAFTAVAAYLRALGLARLPGTTYRSLPIADTTRAELWMGLYVPDADDTVMRRFPNQWQAAADPDGDIAILRLLCDHALDRADALVDGLDIPRELLGFAEVSATRPDLDHLLDIGRPLLPPIAASTSSASA